MVKGFKKKNDKGGHDFIPTDNKKKRDIGSDVEININVDESELDDFAEEKKNQFKGNSEEKLKKIFDFHVDDLSREREEREYDNFTSSIVNFGSGDISTAVSKYAEVGLGGRDLADDVREWVDSTGTDLENVDVVAIAYDKILQEARNEIHNILDFDIINDIHGGTEFYVAGNYMATSYDYSEDAKEQLLEKLKEASDEQLEQLSENIFVKSFLSDIDLF